MWALESEVYNVSLNFCSLFLPESSNTDILVPRYKQVILVLGTRTYHCFIAVIVHDVAAMPSFLEKRSAFHVFSG